MSKTIKEKKYYRVGKTFSNTDKDYNGLLDVPLVYGLQHIALK